jgi:hypothetical protein
MGARVVGSLQGAHSHGELEHYKTYRACRGRVFLATEITAIPALLLYQPVLRDRNYILGADADNRVLLRGLLELLLVVAVISTAVTLYPVVKRQNHSVALGYVCGRLLEATDHRRRRRQRPHSRDTQAEPGRYDGHRRRRSRYGREVPGGDPRHRYLSGEKQTALSRARTLPRRPSAHKIRHLTSLRVGSSPKTPVPLSKAAWRWFK